MSFKKDNENFIRIKLFSEMKGLSDSEKLEKYLLLQEDVFKRLYNSYTNCNNRVEFYKETFELLGFYEGEFLMLNLFLEPNCIEIINSLLCNEFFSRVNIPNVNSISYSFYNFLFSKSNFSENDLVAFLKDLSIEITQTISDIDWNNENSNINPLVNKFADLFAHPAQTDDNKMIAFFLFTKIWNYFDVFINPFNNSKGILLLNDINNSLAKNENSNFYSFYKKISKASNLLFTDINYFPILDTLNRDSYKEGYLKKRKMFWDLLEVQKKRNIVSNEMNYSDLITLIINTDDHLLIEKCEQTIVFKINNFEYPSLNDLEQINKIKEGNKHINAFLQKLYIY